MNFAIAASQARRLLDGLGAMSFVAYQNDAALSIDVLTHRLDEQGRLVIGCAIDDVRHLASEPVRIDIVKKAPEFEADIIASSLHALGTVTWEETTPYLRLGVFTFDTAFFHGVSGPMPFSADALGGTQNIYALTELDARDIVGNHLDEHFSDLIDGVLLGEFRGEIHRGQGNSLYDGGHYLLDISEFGLTLLRVSSTVRIAVQIPFSQPAYTEDELAQQSKKLAAKATARRAASRI